MPLILREVEIQYIVASNTSCIHVAILVRIKCTRTSSRGSSLTLQPLAIQPNIKLNISTRLTNRISKAINTIRYLLSFVYLWQILFIFLHNCNNCIRICLWMQWNLFPSRTILSRFAYGLILRFLWEPKYHGESHAFSLSVSLANAARSSRSMYMVARSREREVKCSNEVAMIEYLGAGISAWVQVYVQVRVTPLCLQSRIVSKHCRCVQCILVIAKGSGIVSRGQERRYSRGRSLDGILDADRLMQRENARL